jgi:hypothetical protein
MAGCVAPHQADLDKAERYCAAGWRDDCQNVDALRDIVGIEKEHAKEEAKAAAGLALLLLTGGIIFAGAASSSSHASVNCTSFVTGNIINTSC